MHSKNIRAQLVFTFMSLAILLLSPHATAGIHTKTKKTQIVTTTPTFADIASKIGGDFVEVKSLMKGRENVHTVPPKPSFVMKLRHADFFIHAGLDGEPWVPQLLNTSRRPNLRVGSPGNIDASVGIHLLEVPDRASLSRANGDVHVYGNPHYMTDPLNGVIVASHIRDVLASHDPDHAEHYNANFDTFEHDIHNMLDRLEKELEPYRDTRVVVYHKAWPYFLSRFHLVEAGEIEPKPDIPPGPRHLIDVQRLIKDQHVRVIIVDTFNPLKVAEKVAKETHISTVVLAGDVHGIKGADDYISLFETNIKLLIAAIQKTDAMSDTPLSHDG